MVLGLCGGYQMLGKRISDPKGVEGNANEVEGLDLLDVVTMLDEEKTLAKIRAHSPAFNENLVGYEIHMGRTGGPDCRRPLFSVERRPEGASSSNGRIGGTYLHGIFSDDVFRRAFLVDLASRCGRASNFPAVDFQSSVESALDEFADRIAGSISIEGVEQVDSLKL